MPFSAQPECTDTTSTPYSPANFAIRSWILFRITAGPNQQGSGLKLSSPVHKWLEHQGDVVALLQEFAAQLRPRIAGEGRR